MNFSIKTVLGSIIVLGIVGFSVIGENLLIPNEDQIIVSGSYYENAPRDPVTFNEIVIENDNMMLEVSFGGGCKKHDFLLVSGSSFMESYPVQIAAVLSHDAHNDSCEALIIKELTFDLSPLKQTYLQIYPPYDWETTITIKIRLESVIEPIIYQFDSNS